MNIHYVFIYGSDYRILYPLCANNGGQVTLIYIDPNVFKFVRLAFSGKLGVAINTDN